MEETKNNSKSFRVAALLLIVALITTTVISGVLAKYTTAFSGTGEITVAKWNVTSKTLGTKADSKTLNLMSTSYDNVYKKRVAPGTEGSFNIGIDPKGTEVGIDYTVTLTFDSATFPHDRIVFTVDGAPSVTTLAPDTTEAGKVIYKYTGKIDMANNSTRLTSADALNQTISWKWLYEEGADANAIAANDLIDTAYGIAAETFTGTVDLIAVQQSPKP